MKKLCHYISEYMGVLVLAAALLALVFPEVLQQVRPTAINYMLGVRPYLLHLNEKGTGC